MDRLEPFEHTDPIAAARHITKELGRRYLAHLDTDEVRAVITDAIGDRYRSADRVGVTEEQILADVRAEYDRLISEHFENVVRPNIAAMWN